MVPQKGRKPSSSADVVKKGIITLFKIGFQNCFGFELKTQKHVCEKATQLEWAESYVGSFHKMKLKCQYVFKK